jgi:hypothetical protein
MHNYSIYKIVQLLGCVHKYHRKAHIWIYINYSYELLFTPLEYNHIFVSVKLSLKHPILEN